MASIDQSSSPQVQLPNLIDKILSLPDELKLEIFSYIFIDERLTVTPKSRKRKAAQMEGPGEGGINNAQARPRPPPPGAVNVFSVNRQTQNDPCLNEAFYRNTLFTVHGFHSVQRLRIKIPKTDHQTVSRMCFLLYPRNISQARADTPVQALNTFANIRELFINSTQIYTRHQDMHLDLERRRVVLYSTSPGGAVLCPESTILYHYITRTKEHLWSNLKAVLEVRKTRVHLKFSLGREENFEQDILEFDSADQCVYVNYDGVERRILQNINL